MKKITELIQDVEVLKVEGKQETFVTDICFDSRKVGEGSLYVAQRGTQVDGHQFIGAAISAGASVIVCEEMPKDLVRNVCYIQVENAAEVLAKIATAFYNYPATKLKLVGVTGTNGKTSIATLLYTLFGKNTKRHIPLLMLCS